MKFVLSKQSPKASEAFLDFAQDDPRKHECRGKMNQGEVPARERQKPENGGWARDNGNLK